MMSLDTLLKNGDFAINEYGMPITAIGLQETLQRCFITLTVQKGSFVYNTALGSELELLKTTPPQKRQGMAELLVKEALTTIPQVRVKNVNIKHCSSERCTLEVTICAYKEIGTLEVSI